MLIECLMELPTRKNLLTSDIYGQFLPFPFIFVRKGRRNVGYVWLLHIHAKKRKGNSAKVVINAQEAPEVSEVKYSGMTLDTKLS